MALFDGLSGNGSGEMKFEVAEKEDVSGLANCIATEIVNEILENALDIATMRGVPGKYPFILSIYQIIIYSSSLFVRYRLRHDSVLG